MTSHQTIKPFPAERWLYLFLCVHLAAWTFVPILIRYNLPLDSIEGTIWGQQLEWGYDKDPFLNGWLTALAIHLGGSSGWMIYLFSQLSVVTCLWAVWQLAKAMLPPVYALASVMLLEMVQYYHLHAIDFNDNTLELGLWALIIYFFYQALRYSRLSAWLLTGIGAGLGMMAKYYTAALLVSLLLFLFLYPENRRQLKTLPPYLGLSLFLLIILPHTLWLFFHDFSTVMYVRQRLSHSPHWSNHLFFPTRFAWEQLQTFLPAILLMIFFSIGKKKKSSLMLTSFNKAFLCFLGLGPFLFTLLLSLAFGVTLRAGWGMPLQSLWGILCVALLQPHLTQTKIYYLVTTVFMAMSLLLIGYSISLTHTRSFSSANFPGHHIAHILTHQWHKQYHTPLFYVAGSRWISGNIGFYSTDHPAVWIEWNEHVSPWINKQDLLEKGAIFVWDITNDEELPATVRKQFPYLTPPFILSFSQQRNHYHLPDIQLGVAFLPPRHAINHFNR